MGAAVVIFLIIVVWVLVKIGQGFVSAADSVSKSYEKSAAVRKLTRFQKGRNRLNQYVLAQVPNELDAFAKKLEYAGNEVGHAHSFTRMVAITPEWTKSELPRVSFPEKESDYVEMCVDDIGAILTPNPEETTWLYEESQILSRTGTYPYQPPIAHIQKCPQLPMLNTGLKPAVLTVDSLHVKRKDVDRYFADDRTKVLKYNERRADLIARATNLNSEIEEWNKKCKVSWEKYCAESKCLETSALLAYEATVGLYANASIEELGYFMHLRKRYDKGQKEAVIERLGFVFDRIHFPNSIPHVWDIDFDEEERIAVMDLKLPDVVHRPPFKIVLVKSGAVKKALNQTEKRESVPKVHPAILLRAAFEIFRADSEETVKLLVLNGWVEYDHPATGINTKAYTASLMVTRDQISGLNLSKIDPMLAFNNLHGKSAGKLVEIVPIEPVLSLNRKDSRFVDAKEVLKTLGAETNLASMDWQDFEHLIRELFEKEFSGRDAEVKVTQTSRDRGVDAIVFDPDPIRGGKYVIQAKRYTNTVDVSAVRDLCAVVKKEGASRGILVTTSTYGADAYAFANNEPITLLNGAELLGLLKKHGYAFRINLQEARRLA